jgi:lipopolysaccharide export LptBFGC system permease protein LptF
MNKFEKFIIKKYIKYILTTMPIVFLLNIIIDLIT